VPINCGSISPELLESELFGHTKGAFTSAHAAREGLFSFASSGTIFLDEISELPFPMQTKLLRVLEDRRIRAVGSDREVAIDARVIAATNRNLRSHVREGRFREDLFFRLDVLTITVPPLRERIEDIAELARHFCQTLARDLGVAPLPMGHDDLRAMQGYSWPGNVRELRNVIERSLLMGSLPAESLQEDATAATQDLGLPLDWTLAEVEKHHFLRVLDAANGNKSAAARRLGVSRKTLERKLKVWAELIVAG
jgi:DNA-binding NtrC family response regulator